MPPCLPALPCPTLPTRPSPLGPSEQSLYEQHVKAQAAKASLAALRFAFAPGRAADAGTWSLHPSFRDARRPKAAAASGSSIPGASRGPARLVWSRRTQTRKRHAPQALSIRLRRRRHEVSITTTRSLFALKSGSATRRPLRNHTGPGNATGTTSNTCTVPHRTTYRTY